MSNNETPLGVEFPPTWAFALPATRNVEDYGLACAKAVADVKDARIAELEPHNNLLSDDLDATKAERQRLRAENEALLSTLEYAEAGLADIGDADREPGDDLAWCESRAAEALPRVRDAIKAARAAREG